MSKYDTQEKCVRVLEDLRWGGKPNCPYCKSMSCCKGSGRNRYHCIQCNRNYSVLVGTIFEDTKLPLPKWFAAISLILSAKKGLSSHQLCRDLGVRQKTAWYLMLRIRSAMHRSVIVQIFNKLRKTTFPAYNNSSLKNPQRKSKNWFRSAEGILAYVKQNGKSFKNEGGLIFSRIPLNRLFHNIRRAIIGQHHHWSEYYTKYYLQETLFRYLYKIPDENAFTRLLEYALDS